MRLRQIALAATDLGATTARTHPTCSAIGEPFRDPGVAVFGLENAVFPIGETFLEVVSPVRDDATAKRWIAKRGGDAGYMVIVQCDDLADARARDRAREARGSGRRLAGRARRRAHGALPPARARRDRVARRHAVVGRLGVGGTRVGGSARTSGRRERSRAPSSRVPTRSGSPRAGRALLGIKARRAGDELEIALPRGGRISFVAGRRGRRARRRGDRARRPRALRSPRARARRARRGRRRDDRRRPFHSGVVFTSAR